ncbi:AlbA family DNA-binding domain-containing protein [Herpetosiphon geysericola]|uniref:Schlafen AlbA-2 domain-containing protein n=1 Tax=Herpetosiphon geysericola TaxID=70996 RepID=A0A0P6XC92_9CHLR|nr:ATP-binding protein [Herpetosiphon geysericola]KPL79941.1 hypothetical protein SE18_25445 [Herpetosiphon geysericola]
MWIPKSEYELQQAIDQGLDESSIFDAKREIATKSKSIAIDIAAMANDGGVIIYGIGEDEHGRPNQLVPIDLKGAADRLTRIVQTCLQEPPQIHISTIRSDIDPAKGYLVVVVPPSPRAPHQVVVDKELRFYGRDTRNNIPLGEGQIAQLYRRRQEAEQDRSSLMGNLVHEFAVAPHPDYAFLYLGIWPILAAEGLMDQIVRTQDEQHDSVFFAKLLGQAQQYQAIPSGYYPEFHQPSSIHRTTKGWLMTLHDQDRGKPGRRYDSALDLDVHDNGHARLFCGRAASQVNGTLQLFEGTVAGLTTHFLWTMGQIYSRAGYVGTVDVGIMVTGMKGALSNALANTLAEPTRMTEDVYTRTTRISTIGLTEASRNVARTLVMPLVRASTRSLRDPFLDR